MSSNKIQSLELKRQVEKSAKDMFEKLLQDIEKKPKNYNFTTSMHVINCI